MIKINTIFDKFEFEKIDNYGKFLVKVYNNNAKNPWKRLIHYYSFRTIENREEYITKFIADQQKRIDYKMARKIERQAVTASQDLIGKIFYDSWGYDMTHSDYLKVTGVTNKKVIAVMIGRSVENDDGRGAGRSYPVASVEKSMPFKLSVRKYGEKYCLVGKYPFCNDSTRSGSFGEYEGKGNYYNTWD